MVREISTGDLKGVHTCHGITGWYVSLRLCFIFGSKLSIRVSWRALSEASSFFANSPLEIVEGSLLGEFRILSDDTVELFIEVFEPPESVGRSPLGPSETIIPFFLLRGPCASVLSVDTFSRRIKDLWNGLSPQVNSCFRFAEFTFLWATAGIDSQNSKRGIAWFTFNAVIPNILPGLQKIKSYPFDSDYFRHCIQTETVKSKFKHLSLLSPDGTYMNYRFGFFLTNRSGCLVSHLDGDRAIHNSTPAGIWCTGVTCKGNGASTPSTNLHTWLVLLRYAFSATGQRTFCTSPVLAVHSQTTNTLSFYSIHMEQKSSREGLGGCGTAVLFPCLDFPPPSIPGFAYANKLHFQMLTCSEDLRSRPPRADTQRLILRLESLNPAVLSNAAVLADFNKLLEAVMRLSRELNCQVTRGPVWLLDGISTAVDSNDRKTQPTKTGKPTKRSVKFSLPSKEVSTAPVVSGFEVPEASMILEEGVACTAASSCYISFPASVPSYNPYRYYTPPQLLSIPQPPAPSTVCCHGTDNPNGGTCSSGGNQAIMQPPASEVPCSLPQPLCCHQLKNYCSAGDPCRMADKSQLISPSCCHLTNDRGSTGDYGQMTSKFGTLSPPCYHQESNDGVKVGVPTPRLEQVSPCLHQGGDFIHKATNCGESNRNEEITRLEALVERLLAAQRPPTTAATSTAARDVSVGTDTREEITRSRSSVAVNTSSVWPTPFDIGLAPPPLVPSKMVESVGVQCEGDVEVLWDPGPGDCFQPRGSCPFPEIQEEFDLPGAPQSPESIISLDAGFLQETMPQTDFAPQCSNYAEKTEDDTGYSRLLAGIQRVLESRPIPSLQSQMRKTVSVPGDLSIIPSTMLTGVPIQRPASSSNARGRECNPTTTQHEQWSTLTDAEYEAELDKRRQRCEEEVAARLDFSNSSIQPPSPPPPRNGLR
uniref:Mediator of RNA polymerase II transcription subunit 13 n=1 Tax=Mesocestoides corti TaxID=53468 RepID=A0A5K3EWT2_MESCO